MSSGFSTQNDLKAKLEGDKSDLKARVNAGIEEARADEAQNPASLSNDPKKKVDVNRPKVDPPLKHVSMNKFLNYLIGGLGLVVIFYIWRVTVWASDAGGYWNLMTGRRPTAEEKFAQMAKAHASAQSAAVSSVTSASSTRSTAGAKGKGRSTANYNNPHHEDVPEKKDVETMVWELAQALGVKPAELSDAIRPLIDPTADNSAVKAAEAEAKAAEAEATAAKAENSNEPGFLDVVEAFME